MTARGRVLVTGDAGFLGSHLCARLLPEEFQVVCLENLLTGQRDNIGPLLNNPAFTFLRGDVVAPIHVDGTLEYVLYLASPASPKDSWTHPHPHA